MQLGSLEALSTEKNPTSMHRYQLSLSSGTFFIVHYLPPNSWCGLKESNNHAGANIMVVHHISEDST
uniref:Uncharacterized protein n=1 Tax=Arundo donax TaxID=35708 RepID=A0A0A9DP65_ARUDO